MRPQLTCRALGNVLTGPWRSRAVRDAGPWLHRLQLPSGGWWETVAPFSFCAWTHWGLSPGLSACEADVIPPHHVPLRRKHATVRKCRWDTLTDACQTPARVPPPPPASSPAPPQLSNHSSRDLPVASLSSYILLSLWGPGDAISISVPISITAQLGHLVRHCLHPFSPTIPPHSDYFPSPQHKYLQVPLLTHLGWSQAQVTPTASPLTSLLPLTDPRRLVPPTGRHRWPPAL